jgi:hypothetical protein
MALGIPGFLLITPRTKNITAPEANKKGIDSRPSAFPLHRMKGFDNGIGLLGSSRGKGHGRMAIAKINNKTVAKVDLSEQREPGGISNDARSQELSSLRIEIRLFPLRRWGE